MITVTVSDIKSHLTKFNDKIKSAVNQISACRGSLYSLWIWRVLTCKIFHYVKTLFMKMAVSFLSALILNWVRSALSIFIWKHSEISRKLLSFFGAMEISFKSESSTSLSDSKQYNCLRCAHFATHFTFLSSKISSVFLWATNYKYFSADKQNQKANVYLQLAKVFQGVWDIILKKLDLLSWHHI